MSTNGTTAPPRTSDALAPVLFTSSPVHVVIDGTVDALARNVWTQGVDVTVVAGKARHTIVVSPEDAQRFVIGQSVRITLS